LSDSLLKRLAIKIPINKKVPFPAFEEIEHFYQKEKVQTFLCSSNKKIGSSNDYKNSKIRRQI